MKSLIALTVIVAVSSVGVLAAPQIFQGGQPPNPFQNFLNLIPFRPFQQQQVVTSADAGVIPAAPLPPPQNPWQQIFQFQPPQNGWFQLPNIFPNWFNNPINPMNPALGQDTPTIIVITRPNQHQPQLPAEVAQDANIQSADFGSPVQAIASATASSNSISGPSSCKYFDSE